VVFQYSTQQGFRQKIIFCCDTFTFFKGEIKMTNAKTTIWLAAVVISVAGSPVLSVMHFADGGVHNINYVIGDYVYVDYMSPGLETTVNLLPGGKMSSYLNAYEDSWINILGGEIVGGIFATQRAHVSMSDGSIDGLGAALDAQINISGGSIANELHVSHTNHVNIQGGTIGNLNATNNSHVDIYDGSIQDYLLIDTDAQAHFFGGSVGGDFRLDFGGTLNIYGWGFEVGGTPVGYGELTSILGDYWYDETARHLTGTLASGEPISNDFYIGHDAKIVLVPAPGAVVLGSIGLSFAGWKLRRRKKL
jgi:hypothetical protein